METEEEVYMGIPPGFNYNCRGDKVSKLKNALYGFKQLPQAWFGRFNKAMFSIGILTKLK